MSASPTLPGVPREDLYAAAAWRDVIFEAEYGRLLLPSARDGSNRWQIDRLPRTQLECTPVRGLSREELHAAK